MEMGTNFDDVVYEIHTMSERTSKVVEKTRKLINMLDEQTKILIQSKKKIQAMLNIKDRTCSICQEREATHCVGLCGHTYCRSCASRSLRSPSKCFICREPVSTMFKIY